MSKLPRCFFRTVLRRSFQMISKRHFATCFVFLFSVLFADWTVIAAQQASNPKRIELRSKGPAVVVSGEVSKKSEAVYIFSAKAGQRFTGQITRKDGNIGFDVTDPDGEALPEEE